MRNAGYLTTNPKPTISLGDSLHKHRSATENFSGGRLVGEDVTYLVFNFGPNNIKVSHPSRYKKGVVIGSGKALKLTGVHKDWEIEVGSLKGSCVGTVIYDKKFNGIAQDFEKKLRDVNFVSERI